MGLYKETPLIQKLRQSFWFKALWEGDLYLISSTTVVSIAVYSQEPNLEVLNSVWSGQRKLFPEKWSQDMIYFWFLTFPLKINKIMLSGLFYTEDCIKGKGWKWTRKLFIHQLIISVIKVYILANPTFWDGQAMSRDTEPTLWIVSYPWFCLVQVLWSQRGNGMQGGAILRCQGTQKKKKKKIPSNNYPCQHLWTLLIEDPHNEITACHCSRSMGWVCSPFSLRIFCLAAGGCLDFHHNLWSYPCSQEPAHRAQPATVWWITLWLCLPLSAADGGSPDGWHLCAQKLKFWWDGSHPHCSHTANCSVKRFCVCLKADLFTIANSGTAGWATWSGG